MNFDIPIDYITQKSVQRLAIQKHRRDNTEVINLTGNVFRCEYSVTGYVSYRAYKIISGKQYKRHFKTEQEARDYIAYIKGKQ